VLQFAADLISRTFARLVAASICGRVIRPMARSAASSSRFRRIAAASSRSPATSTPLFSTVTRSAASGRDSRAITSLVMNGGRPDKPKSGNELGRGRPSRVGETGI
jgi:hypothetical protein